MSQFPEQIRIKRKAADDPVEALYLQTERGRKKHLTDVAYRLLKSTSESDSAKGDIPTKGLQKKDYKVPVSSDQALLNLPTQHARVVSTALRETLRSRSRNSRSTERSQSRSPRKPKNILGQSGVHKAAPNQRSSKPRIFRLALSQEQKRALRDSEHVSSGQKRKLLDGSSLATFVEAEGERSRSARRERDASITSATPATQKQPSQSIDDIWAQAAQARREYNETGLVPSPVELRTDRDMQRAPKLVIEAERDRDEKARQEKKPHQSALRGSGAGSETNSGQDKTASTKASGATGVDREDKDYVYDVYVREPIVKRSNNGDGLKKRDGGDSAPENSSSNKKATGKADDLANALEAVTIAAGTAAAEESVGLIIIGAEEEEQLIFLAEEEDGNEGEREWEDDEDDENAEDYYANDYPDEEDALSDDMLNYGGDDDDDMDGMAFDHQEEDQYRLSDGFQDRWY